MPVATAVRTVTAVCACGASFEREVKRGRPQVWCPACREVPFYERTAAPVKAASGDPEAPEAAPEPQNQLVWQEDTDCTPEQRYRIEERIRQANAEWPALYKELKAAGLSAMEISLRNANEIRRIYHEEGHKKWLKWSPTV